MVKPVPDGYHTVTPYLVVPDVRAQLEFLSKAFGGVLSEQIDEQGGDIRHAEITIGDSVIMIGMARDGTAPSSSMFYLYVDDCDAYYQRALDAGATSVMPPEKQFYGDRSGGVRDAFGNQWWVATHVEDVSPEELQRRASEQQGGDEG